MAMEPHMLDVLISPWSKEIHQLNVQKIIPQGLATHILKTNDLNALWTYQSSALHYAVKAGKLWAVQALKRQGADLGITDSFCETPFLIAVAQGEVEIVRYFLQVMKNEDLFKRNFDGMTALHVAAAHNQRAVMEVLLQDPRFPPQLNQNDLYSRTPFHVALGNKADAILSFMDPSNQFKAQVDYGRALINVEQEVVNQKFIEYLKLKNKEQIINPEGMCRGWTFVYKMYLPDEQAFYDALTSIVAWDGTRDSLHNTDIPHACKKECTNLEEIFELMIKRVVLCQGKDKSKFEEKDASSFECANKRLAQYAYLTNNADKKIKQIAVYKRMILNQAQLLEWIEFFSRWPGASIDITIIFESTGHALSLNITQDRLFKYYDPNYKNKISPLSSAEIIVNYIQKTIEMFTREKTHIKFEVYKFYTGENVEEKAVEGSHFSYSPNDFTKLHYAIMEFNDSKLEKLLTESIQTNDFTALHYADAHGFTPLKRALTLKNTKAIIALLHAEAAVHGKPHTNEFTWKSLSENELHQIKNLMLSGDINPNLTDKNDKTILTYFLEDHSSCIDLVKHDKKQTQKKSFLKKIIPQVEINQVDVSGEHVLLVAMKHGWKEKVWQAILEHPKLNINMVDKDNRPILISILKLPLSQKEICDYLKDMLKHSDIDVNALYLGKSFLIYALKAKLPSEILLQIIHHKNFKLEDPQLNKNSALMHAILTNADDAVIMALLEKTTCLNHINKKGKNALMLAVKKRRETLVKELLNRDVDVTKRNNKGHTALDILQPNSDLYHLLNNDYKSTIGKNHIIASKKYKMNS